MAKSNRDVKNLIEIENFDERVATGPLKVELSIKIHIFYKMIVESLQLDLEEGTARFLEGVKLYVFLGAMFETLINELIRRYLKSHRDAPPEMFSAVERQQLAEKLKVIERRIEGDWWADGPRLIRKVSEMRNRLLHFKDPPTLVDVASIAVSFDSRKVNAKDLFDALHGAIPNPKIYDELVDEDLDGLRRKCVDLYEAMSRIVVADQKV